MDDDPSVRRALIRLVESMSLRARAYASPEELLHSTPLQSVGCLLLDVQLPGMDGFELNRRMIDSGRGAPVIFITGHPSAQSRSAAAKANAAAYLEKPFDDQLRLFDAIELAPQSLERRTTVPHGPAVGSRGPISLTRSTRPLTRERRRRHSGFPIPGGGLES